MREKYKRRLAASAVLGQALPIATLEFDKTFRTEHPFDLRHIVVAFAGELAQVARAAN